MKRNTAIDVLRGYCIVMMITSHVGVATYFNSGVHFLRFVSGAEGFVLLSGLVLGMVYKWKLDVDSTYAPFIAIWRRAAMIWAVHCTLVLAALALNERWLHLPDMPDVSGYGVLRTVWLTVIMRLQPAHLLNILPLYVFLLAATPFILYLLKHGRIGWVMAVSMSVFIWTQWEPGLGHWVLSSSGGDAFPPLSWQGLFIPGLCIGWYHHTIHAKILEPHRKAVTLAMGLVCIVILIIAAVQTATFQFYNHELWDLYLWERHPLRFGRLIYFMVSVSLFYLLAQWWLSKPKLPRFLFNVLATLGRNSLYAFIVHVILAFSISKWQPSPDRWILLESVPIGMILIVYLMAKYKVGRKWIPN